MVRRDSTKTRMMMTIIASNPSDCMVGTPSPTLVQTFLPLERTRIRTDGSTNSFNRVNELSLVELLKPRRLALFSS